MIKRLQGVIDWLSVALVFLLPIQTIWIWREINLNGFKWQQGTVGFYVTELIFWFLVVLQISKWIKEKKKLRKIEWNLKSVFLLSVVCLSVYVGLTVLWSKDTMLAQVMWVKLLEGLLLMVIVANNKDNWMRISWAVVVSGIIQGTLSLIQFLNQYIYANKWLGIAKHDPSLGGTYVVEPGTIRWLRAYGSFSHPNILGGFLVIAFILSWTIYLRIENRLLKLVSLVGVLMSSVGIFFSFSRSAWLAYVLVIVWLFLINFKNKYNKGAGYRLLIYAIVLVVTMGTIYNSLVFVRLSGSGRLEEKSVAERIDLLKDAKEVIGRNWALGTGIGNYTYYIYQNDQSRPGWAYQPVHNVPLLIWGELGLIGLILSLTMVLSLFVIVIRKRGIISISFVLLLALGVMAIFDHYLWSQYFGLMFSGLVIGFSLSE